MVDTDVFVPSAQASSGPFVLGWIGTHSTFPYLREIFPVLQDLANDAYIQAEDCGRGHERVSIPESKSRIWNGSWNAKWKTFNLSTWVCIRSTRRCMRRIGPRVNQASKRFNTWRLAFHL